MVRIIANIPRRLRRLNPWRISGAAIVGGVVLINIIVTVEIARSYALPAHFV